MPTSDNKTTESESRRIRWRNRTAFGMSQAELADRLNIQRASFTKFEQGRDLHLSTLQTLIEAMGGQLSLVARFPEGDLRPPRIPIRPSAFAVVR